MKHHLIRRDTQIVCKFCDKLCHHGQRQGMKDWWHCNPCHLSYLINHKQYIHVYEFRISLNDKQYFIEVYPILNKTDIIVWDSSPNFLADEEVIVSLNSAVNLSPDNLQEKLKTILLFL